MRLRFWGRDERALFDPGAGEVPEHLEVYPPGKPFPWRDLVRAMALTGIILTVWRGLDVFKNRDADPGPLVAVESASLQVVCAEASHFQELHRYAPCDPSQLATFAINDVPEYYVAFAVHLGTDGHMSGRKAYLLKSDCYLATFATLEPIDNCVAGRLQD